MTPDLDELLADITKAQHQPGMNAWWQDVLKRAHRAIIDLRKAVPVPITKENCNHPRRIGNGSLSSDGSSKTSWYCPDCHASYEFESPPSQRMPKVPEIWR